MNAQLDDKALEDSLAEGLADMLPQKAAVSQQEFCDVVDGALEAVGGRLLFKMEIGSEDERQHVAAASVGPLAGITAAYAGLMDVLQAAA